MVAFVICGLILNFQDTCRYFGMTNRPSCVRVAMGQSPDDTAIVRFMRSAPRRLRAFMVSMKFTIIVGLAMMPNPMRADDAMPHVTAVAVAKAQIMSGIRIDRDYLQADNERPLRGNRLPKPRERPCPEADTHPCRLIVVDMP